MPKPLTTSKQPWLLSNNNPACFTVVLSLQVSSWQSLMPCLAGRCTGERLLVGAGAGGLAQVAVYPLEVIQTRLAATHGAYAGIGDAAAKIWRTEGPAAFMRCARPSERASAKASPPSILGRNACE